MLFHIAAADYAGIISGSVPMLLGERRALQYCRPTVLQQQTDMHRPIMKSHQFYLATHMHMHNTVGLAYMYLRWPGVCPSVCSSRIETAEFIKQSTLDCSLGLKLPTALVVQVEQSVRCVCVCVCVDNNFALNDLLPRRLPCPCSPMVKPLGRHVQYSVTFAVAEDRFEPRPGRVRLLKKNYFK